MATVYRVTGQYFTAHSTHGCLNPSGLEDGTESSYWACVIVAWLLALSLSHSNWDCGGIRMVTVEGAESGDPSDDHYNRNPNDVCSHVSGECCKYRAQCGLLVSLVLRVRQQSIFRYGIGSLLYCPNDNSSDDFNYCTIDSSYRYLRAAPCNRPRPVVIHSFARSSRHPLLFLRARFFCPHPPGRVFSFFHAFFF